MSVAVVVVASQNTLYASDDLDPAKALWQAEYQQHVVGRAIDVMNTDFQPATWQACLALVYGKPAAQVAQETGLTVEAVYAAKARVLRRLRQELAGLLD